MGKSKAQKKADKKAKEAAKPKTAPAAKEEDKAPESLPETPDAAGEGEIEEPEASKDTDKVAKDIEPEEKPKLDDKGEPVRKLSEEEVAANEKGLTSSIPEASKLPEDHEWKEDDFGSGEFWDNVQDFAGRYIDVPTLQASFSGVLEKEGPAREALEMLEGEARTFWDQQFVFLFDRQKDILKSIAAGWKDKGNKTEDREWPTGKLRDLGRRMKANKKAIDKTLLSVPSYARNNIIETSLYFGGQALGMLLGAFKIGV